MVSPYWGRMISTTRLHTPQAYRGNAGHDDLAIGVLFRPWLPDHLGAPLHGLLEDETAVVDGKGNVANPVAVLGNVRIHGLLGGIQGALKDEKDLVQLYHVAGDLAMARLQPAIGRRLKTEARAIIGGGLAGIADPKDDMVEPMILAPLSHGQGRAGLGHGERQSC